jgi:hypothetical protein
MDGAARVAVPGGWPADDGETTEIWIRPLTGADEASVIERIGRSPAPVLANELIGRCVVLAGDVPIGIEAARALPAGSRETLLWRIRVLLSGDLIDASVTCPACGEKASVEIDLEDVTVGRLTPPRIHLDEIEGRRVEFRSPTGRDLEELTRGSVADLRGAAQQLAAACILAVDDAPPSDEELAALADPVGDRIATLDPAAEVLLDSRCPHCKSPFTASLDATSFLLEEIAAGARYLFEEVHVLASMYHWSEGDILDMTPRRRRTYLDLIAESSGGP